MIQATEITSSKGLEEALKRQEQVKRQIASEKKSLMVKDKKGNPPKDCCWRYHTQVSSRQFLV